MNPGRQRNRSVDVVRGIAMICIVLGHLGEFEIVKVVFTFHLPVFFLITGYYFNPENNWKTFILKKARTLLIPYATASIMIALLASLNDAFLFHGEQPFRLFLNWIAAALYGAGDSTPRLLNVHQIGALWFLLATFWGGIFLRFATSIKYPYVRVLIIIFTFVAGWRSNSLWYPLSIQAGGPASLFMYIGYQIRQNSNQGNKLSKEQKLATLSFCIPVWYWFVQNFQSFYLVHADVGQGCIDILASLCACYVIFFVSSLIDKYIEIIAKPLSFLGENSVIVLCMHIVELNCIPWWMVLDKLQSYGMPEDKRFLATIILKFLWIIPLTILCSQINQLRKLFGLKNKTNK